jgi:hypothetical protein
MGGIEANSPTPTMARMTTQFEHVACMHILGDSISNKLQQLRQSPT